MTGMTTTGGLWKDFGMDLLEDAGEVNEAALDVEANGDEAAVE